MRVATNTEMSDIQSQINQQVAILNRPGAKVEYAREIYFSPDVLGDLDMKTYSENLDIATVSNRTYYTIACFMGSANPIDFITSRNNIRLTVELYSPGASKTWNFGWRSSCGANIFASGNQLISGSLRAPYRAGNVSLHLYNRTGWNLNFQENSSTESKFVVFVVSYLNTTEVYS